MKIIAQKTNFYLDGEFFNEILLGESVTGVNLNVVFNRNGKLLIYNNDVQEKQNVQKIQNTDLENLQINSVLTLEEALERIKACHKELEIFLNIIPISMNITDDASLKLLTSLNHQYLSKLTEILKAYSSMKICVHSISRNLVLLLQEKKICSKVGFVVYAGELTPTDANYYVFMTYMIDDVIFEELIQNKKELVIYISNQNDLATIAHKYTSEKTTALSSKILPHLNFIVNQPILIEKLFENEKIS